MRKPRRRPGSRREICRARARRPGRRGWTAAPTGEAGHSSMPSCPGLAPAGRGQIREKIPWESTPTDCLAVVGGAQAAPKTRRTAWQMHPEAHPKGGHPGLGHPAPQKQMASLDEHATHPGKGSIKCCKGRKLQSKVTKWGEMSRQWKSGQDRLHLQENLI